MSTKRKVQIPDSHTSRGPARPWPPICGLCGFVGEANDTASPYIGCSGDPTRHRRSPVNAYGRHAARPADRTQEQA